MPPRTPELPFGREEFVRRARQASTLIELLVSLCVLSVAFFSLLGLLSNGYRANVLSRDTTIATQLAREYVEQYRKTDYATLASIAEAKVDISGIYQGKKYTVTFLRKLDVASGLSGSGKLLTSTVRWKSNNVWHHVEVRILVATPS